MNGDPRRRVGPQVTPVALFTATRWEFLAVCQAVPGLARGRVNAWRVGRGRRGGREVCVVRTGVGIAEARRAAEAVLGGGPFGAALSIGFSGALGPARVADVLIGTEVLCGSSSVAASGPVIACAPFLAEIALSSAEAAGLPAHSGRLLTVRFVVTSARGKAALGETFGALGVDMESAAVGAAAAEEGVPFLAIRTISDGVDDDLPTGLQDFLAPGGWGRGVLHLMSRPQDWAAFVRLRRNSRLAAHRLRAFVGGFLDALA